MRNHTTGRTVTSVDPATGDLDPGEVLPEVGLSSRPSNTSTRRRMPS